MGDNETDTKILWRSWVDEALEWGWAEHRAVQYANDKLADLEARAIDAAMEAERVF